MRAANSVEGPSLHVWTNDAKPGNFYPRHSERHFYPRHPERSRGISSVGIAEVRSLDFARDDGEE
ncbi:hypothetical protein BAQU_1652 [Bifidobacterium aquikefiri]|uniref:Uncharacterized protein n=1 Tax=Bifidobacterium aquikefiri TaxID=1653207 RepID=A0A261G200_9BIFI|nr:hypothetical protein BAQU_1652 [Bifidobacterium aquikefiri]